MGPQSSRTGCVRLCFLAHQNECSLNNSALHTLKQLEGDFVLTIKKEMAGVWGVCAPYSDLRIRTLHCNS